MVWGFQLWELRVCAILNQQVPEVVCRQSLLSSVPVSQNICAEKSKKCQGKCSAAWALAWAELSVGVVGGHSKDMMLGASQANPRTGWENLLAALKI